MPCTCPLDAWPPAPGSGSKLFSFSAVKSYAGAKSVKLPCGRCIGCRLDRARTWGIRMMHEAQLQDEIGPLRNHFWTLTFADEHLPRDRSIRKRDVQLVMSRLMKRVGHPIRYFACGEYGEKFGRPHYHLALFGLPLHDREPWGRSSNGSILYRSPTLEAAWPYGKCEVSELTLKSAEYVARYTLKKVSDDLAEERYRREDPLTGRSWMVEREFALMSRRPGIGAGWIERFKDDVRTSGFIVINGEKLPAPRYYRLKLDEADNRKLTTKSKARALRVAHDNTDSRLFTKHQVRELKATRLARELDGQS